MLFSFRVVASKEISLLIADLEGFDMNYSKAPGLTLIETSLLLVFASALMFMVNTRAGVQKVGQAVKVSTEKLIKINGLLEQASTGELAGISASNPLRPTKSGLGVISNPVLALNPVVSSDAGLQSSYVSGRIPLPINTNDLNARKMEYTWQIEDVSRNDQTDRTPNGLRLYNAILKIYKSPTDSQPEAFNIILQVNTRQKDTFKIGMELLFDDSTSMIFNPKNVLGKDGPVSALTIYRNVSSPTYSDQFPDKDFKSIVAWQGMPVGIPALNGQALASTTDWERYKKSSLGYQAKVNLDETPDTDSISFGGQAFPYLAYRYKSLGKYQNKYLSQFSGASMLDPFDENQLDITFDYPKNYKSRGQGDGVHTYPGPGVLGMPQSGQDGSCDMDTEEWAKDKNVNILRQYFTSGFARGLTSVPDNGNCSSRYVESCNCGTLENWLKKGGKLPDRFFKFNGDAAFQKDHYQEIDLKEIKKSGNNGPYGLYHKMLGYKSCVFQPLVPPFHPVDHRENVRRLCDTKWPNNTDKNSNAFRDFKDTYMVPLESARNALIRFVLNLEDPLGGSYNLLINSAEIGFIPFHNQPGVLEPTPAKKVLQNKTNRFEELRMNILSINRHGAPLGSIYGSWSTPTYETLEKGIAALNKKDSAGKNKYGTRIILMITDGMPTGKTSKDVLALAKTLKNQEIALFVIAMTNSLSAKDTITAKKDMQDWATSSWGGEALFADSDDELKAAFEQMNVLIQRQISIGIINSYNYI